MKLGFNISFGPFTSKLVYFKFKNDGITQPTSRIGIGLVEVGLKVYPIHLYSI